MTRKQYLDRLNKGKTLVKLIQSTWFPNLKWAHSFIDNYFGHLASSPRGTRQVILDLKAIRLQYTRWFSNTKLECFRSMSDTASSTHEFPSVLKRWGAPEVREVESIKFTLTVLSFTRSIKLPTVPDLGIIEDRAILDDGSLNEFREFCTVASKSWMKEHVSNIEWKTFHFSTKSGPNGQAMYTSFEDYRLLPDLLKQDLREFGGPQLDALFTKIDSHDESIGRTPFKLVTEKFPVKKSRGIIRRISFIPDKEGKTRTIGILDYWSQSVLKPLHDGISRILKGLKADMTFRQDKPVGSSSDGYLSADLKAATDSFPVEIQEIVLASLIGPEKASIWKRIMTSHGFKAPHRVDPVFYNRGQPMGAYSSWPVFSITHHFLVQYAAKRAGKVRFTDYALLGDDIVIKDKQVGREYLNLLDVFQIPLAVEKSMWSESTYEFAKRWFLDCQEVSPFPISGLFENGKYYHTFHNLLVNANRKGFPFSMKEDRSRGFVRSVWDTLQPGRKWADEQSTRRLKLMDVFDTLHSEEPAKSTWELLKVLYPLGSPDKSKAYQVIYTQDWNLGPEETLLRMGKLLLLWSDLLHMQEFYNRELDNLKQGVVLVPYLKDSNPPSSIDAGSVGNTAVDESLGTPPYEYADVWPPLGVARGLIRSYLRFLDTTLENHKETCQLDDPLLVEALVVSEVPKFMISRKVITERSHRAKLGAKARLVKALMNLWSDRWNSADLDRLTERYGVAIELDFDEWDECRGRVVLEPMSVRDARWRRDG